MGIFAQTLVPIAIVQARPASTLAATVFAGATVVALAGGGAAGGAQQTLVPALANGFLVSNDVTGVWREGAGIYGVLLNKSFAANRCVFRAQVLGATATGLGTVRAANTLPNCWMTFVAAAGEALPVIRQINVLTALLPAVAATNPATELDWLFEMYTIRAPSVSNG